MSRRVSKAGGANAYGVYGFIRDLIMEGKDAEFVDNRGRYRLKWPRALDRYADYKAKKKPHLKRTNQINRRTDSNRLRSALLNSYKKEGAREHKESKKVNEEDQVVERQFQMPPRVFEALFSDAKLSDSNEEQDEQEGKTHLSEGADGAQASHESSSDAGFNETMDSSFDFLGSPDSRALLSTSRGNVLTNPSLDDSADVKTEGPGNHFSDSAFQITQIFDDDSVESAVEEFLSESDEIFGHDCFMGVVRDIFPASGPVKGGYYFEISLSEPLPDNVSSGVAEFEGVGTAELTKSKPSKLFGVVPASDKARDVRVKVSSQSGECLGCTDFHYVDEMREMIKQLIHDPVKLSSFMTMWLQECHFYGFEMQFQGDVDFTTQAKQKQLVKILELLVYTAAQTGAKQFIEMIFSTSAQQIVFDSYKERATLPEDVARANGHFNLAQYLQDINTRLTKEVGDEPKSIDWLELLKAVQNQVSVSQDKESKKEKTPVENDDYSSDYFADDETSSCGSFEHDDEFTSNPEGKDTAEKGGSITNLLQRYGPYDERIVISNSKVLEAGAYRHQNLVLHRDITAADIVFVSTEETSSEATKCRGVYESKEERRALMTENVVVSASTCRLKRPGYLVLSPLEADERQLNQEQVIFAKSIGDESVHSPSTLLPSCPVLNKSSQSSCGASLHGLSSGNVSWKKESKIKELKMARVRSWLSCKPSSEEFPSAEGFET